MTPSPVPPATLRWRRSGLIFLKYISDAFQEFAYRILDLESKTAEGYNLQFQDMDEYAVGDEAVIAVGGEEGLLGTGSLASPRSDDEPHRRGSRAHSGQGI